MWAASSARPAISRRVDTMVIPETSTGAEEVSLLTDIDAWSVDRVADPVDEVARWVPRGRLEARMRGSVLNDVTDRLLLAPGDEVRHIVRRCWHRREIEELERPRTSEVPRPAETLTDDEVMWIFSLADAAARVMRTWGTIDEMQEGLWVPAAIAPDCRGGVEDYRMTSRATGASRLIDLKCLKEPMRIRRGGRLIRRWPKDEIYAEAYLVAAAACGRPADGVAILDPRHGDLAQLKARDFLAARDGAVAREVCRRVFGMDADATARVLGAM